MRAGTRPAVEGVGGSRRPGVMSALVRSLVDDGIRTHEVEMAVPKRRHSKTRKRKRRTHHKAPAIALQACARCGDPKRPHHVCPTCGYYAGRQRVTVAEDV